MWLALRDSNPRLADYEPAVLTAELRAGKFRGHVGTGTGGQGVDQLVQRCKAERSYCAKVQRLTHATLRGALVEPLISWPERNTGGRKAGGGGIRTREAL